MDGLENGHSFLSKMMSYFRPCDLRRCHVTKNSTDTRLRLTFLVVFYKLSKNFFLVKPCIHGYKNLYR